MNEQLIREIEELKSKLYDQESELLRVYGDVNGDYHGNNTRRIADLRQSVELLDRTIKMLREERN